MVLKKILVIQPDLNPPGGGNGVCAWIIETLKSRYQTSLLCWDEPCFDQVNAYFGTSIEGNEIRILTVNSILKQLVDSLPFPAGLLKSSILSRISRSYRKDFDLMISGNNEFDFADPGIQYIHFPRYCFPRPEVDIRWYHRFVPATEMYYLFCRMIGESRRYRMRKNLTLVNSRWTLGRLGKGYENSRTGILFPPIAGPFSDTPWEHRKNGFVSIGRISPEKKILEMIRILDEIRMDNDIEYHIIGTPDDEEYFRLITGQVEKRKSWVRLHTGLNRKELLALASGNRFGIHGMENEHFGMGIAEMILSGNIVFVPDGGGQKEITGNCSHLLYHSKEDAVEKIRKVIHSNPLQTSLKNYLDTRKKLLALDNFQRKLLDHVERFLK